ncbi:MAG TPA: hypothetical protein VJ782_01545 [Aeromicrobium sp.]|nr:hypothetical protein [Aeromicrobium sp.]
MSKVKVIWRIKSKGIKPRDTAMVEQEQADALVANGHAVLAKEASAEVKASPKP